MTCLIPMRVSISAARIGAARVHAGLIFGGAVTFVPQRRFASYSRAPLLELTSKKKVPPREKGPSFTEHQWAINSMPWRGAMPPALKGILDDKSLTVEQKVQRFHDLRQPIHPWQVETGNVASARTFRKWFEGIATDLMKYSAIRKPLGPGEADFIYYIRQLDAEGRKFPVSHRLYQKCKGLFLKASLPLAKGLAKLPQPVAKVEKKKKKPASPKYVYEGEPKVVARQSHADDTDPIRPPLILPLVLEEADIVRSLTGLSPYEFTKALDKHGIMGTREQIDILRNMAVKSNSKRIEYMNLNMGTSFVKWLLRLHGETRNNGGRITAAYTLLGSPFVAVLECVRAMDADEMGRLADYYTLERIATMTQWGRLIRLEAPLDPERQAVFALAWRVRNAMKGEAFLSGPSTEEESAEALRTTALPQRLPYVHRWIPLKVMADFAQRDNDLETFFYAEAHGLPFSLRFAKRGGAKRPVSGNIEVATFWIWVGRVREDSLRRFPRMNLGRRGDVAITALKEAKAFEILDFAPTLLHRPSLAQSAWRGVHHNLRIGNSVYCHVVQRMRGDNSAQPATEPAPPVGLDPRHQDQTLHVGSCIADGYVWNDFYDKVEQYNLYRNPVEEVSDVVRQSEAQDEKKNDERPTTNEETRRKHEAAVAHQASRLFAGVGSHYVRAPSILGLSAIRAVVNSLDSSHCTKLDVINALEKQRLPGSFSQINSLFLERQNARCQEAASDALVDDVDPVSIVRPFLDQVVDFVSEYSVILKDKAHAQCLRYTTSHLGPHQDKIYDYVCELCAEAAGYSVLRLIDDPLVELSVFLTIRDLQQGWDPSVYRRVFERDDVQREAGLWELPCSRTDSETMPLSVLAMQQKYLLSAKLTNLACEAVGLDRLPWLEVSDATVKIMKAYCSNREYLIKASHVLDELCLPGSARQLAEYIKTGLGVRAVTPCKLWLKRVCPLLESMRHAPDAAVVQRLGKHGRSLLRALASLGFTWDTDIKQISLDVLIEVHNVLCLAMGPSFDTRSIVPVILVREREGAGTRSALSQVLLGSSGQATLLRLPAIGYPSLVQTAAALANRSGLRPNYAIQLDAAGVPFGIEQTQTDREADKMGTYATPLPLEHFRAFLKKVLECQAKGNLAETYYLGYHERAILEALETLKLTPAAVLALGHERLEAAHTTLSAAMCVSPQDEARKNEDQLHSQQRNINYKRIFRRQRHLEIAVQPDESSERAKAATKKKATRTFLIDAMPYYGLNYPLELVALAKEAVADLKAARGSHGTPLVQLYLLERNFSVSTEQVRSILVGLTALRTTGERHIVDVATSRPVYERDICGAKGFREWLLRIHRSLTKDAEWRTYRQGPHAQVYEEMMERHVLPQFQSFDDLRLCNDNKLLYSIHQHIRNAITDTGLGGVQIRKNLDAHLYSRMPMCGFFLDETHRQIMTDAWEALDTRMWLLTKHGYPGSYAQLRRLPTLTSSRTETFVEPSSEFRTWVLSCMKALEAGTSQDLVLGAPKNFRDEFLSLMQGEVSMVFVGACSDDALYSIYDNLSTAMLTGFDEAPTLRPSPSTTESTLWLSRAGTSQRMRSSVHRRLLEDAQLPPACLLLQDANTAMVAQGTDTQYLTLKLSESLNAQEIRQC